MEYTKIRVAFSRLFLVIVNLPFIKVMGEILSLDLFCKSLKYYATLTPRVSAFLGIPNTEFDILNIFIKIILLGMDYHFR